MVTEAEYCHPMFGCFPPRALVGTGSYVGLSPRSVPPLSSRRTDVAHFSSDAHWSHKRGAQDISVQRTVSFLQLVHEEAVPVTVAFLQLWVLVLGAAGEAPVKETGGCNRGESSRDSQLKRGVAMGGGNSPAS